MIDLSKYVLSENLPAVAQITDAADIEVLEKLQFEEKSFIVKTTHAMGENIPNATFCILMNYIDAATLKGFVGTSYVWTFAILCTEQAWVLEMFVPE